MWKDVLTLLFYSALGLVTLLATRRAKRLHDEWKQLKQEMKAEEGFVGVVSGLEALVGEEVTVFTDMRPSGKVQTADGRIVEATLKFGGFASKGDKLRVISAEQGRVYCSI